MDLDLETRISILEAQHLANMHALGAILTAIAEMDLEVAAGITALLEDLIDASREMGNDRAAVAIENIFDLATMAVMRGAAG